MVDMTVAAVCIRYFQHLPYFSAFSFAVSWNVCKFAV